MKFIGCSFLLVGFVCCVVGLTVDDLVEDTSWVAVKDTTRRGAVPNDELMKLDGNFFVCLLFFSNFFLRDFDGSYATGAGWGN